MDLHALAERVAIVLVEPQHPGNVGAAARAMKNMGLNKLVLVNPPAFDPERARWMAPGCDDVIANARIVATLEEGLQGIHRVVATTARHRKYGHPIVTPRKLATQIFDEPDGRVTGILFGREDFGLSTEDVNWADTILRIPTPEHASLNLGQAVLLICHTLFQAATDQGVVATGRTIGGSRGTKTTREAHRTDRRDRLADLQMIAPAADSIVDVLDRVGYMRKTAPAKVQMTARQALQRANLTQRQVEAIRGMVARIEYALDHPEKDWKATRSAQRTSEVTEPPDDSGEQDG